VIKVVLLKDHCSRFKNYWYRPRKRKQSQVLGVWPENWYQMLGQLKKKLASQTLPQLLPLGSLPLLKFKVNYKIS
jgi:hypothetical protein